MLQLKSVQLITVKPYLEWLINTVYHIKLCAVTKKTGFETRNINLSTPASVCKTKPKHTFTKF